MPHKDRVYNKEYHRIRHKMQSVKIKTDVLTYYGGGKLACGVCGENRIACLSIDHMNGDGA